MQIIRRYLAGIIVVVCLLSSVFSMQSRQVAVYLPMQANTEMEKRACWISYIDMESELSDKSEAAFRAKVHAMYDTVKRYGLNTVIVHARAMGDAFYPSDYFPYSEYMSKSRTYPGYDPYEIMVAVAHEEGLRFEAWINPYRLSLGEETTASFEHTPFYAKYQSMILEYQGQNGTCLVLDPQSAEAQQLVVNQVAEILERYPVDGIHFDDYFFVDGMQDTLPQEEKMQAVNALVQKVYQTVKQKRPDCEFGISPAGNPDYARSQGADIDTWLSQEGYVDYVMPQIYWTDRYVTDGKEVPMFSNRCEVWQTLHTNPEIKLYAGLALYRVGETSDTDLDWALREDNLATQCAHIYGMGYDGFALFRYAYLKENGTQVELQNLYSYLKKQAGILKFHLMLVLYIRFICRLLAGRKQKWTALWQDIQSRKNPLKRCASSLAHMSRKEMSGMRLRRHRDKVHGGRTANRRAVLDRRNRCLESGSISQAESQIPMIFCTAFMCRHRAGRTGEKMARILEAVRYRHCR